MDILHKSGNQPALEGHDLVDEWTGFMHMRKPQQRDRLTEKLLSDQASQAEYRRGIDSLIQGLVDLLPNPLQECVASPLRLAFLISATSRAMASKGDQYRGGKQEAAGSGRS